jgi:glycine cleavage system aminomethyltransferase T
MGGGALESMRLEKGYRLWGTDIDTDSDPFAAGLGFAVDMDTDFVGREALAEVRESGPDSRLTPVTLDDSSDVVLGGRPVLDGEEPRSSGSRLEADGNRTESGDGEASETPRTPGEALGYVVAGDYGYSVGESIAYAYLPSEYADAGTSVRVLCEGTTYDATVRDEPLFDPGREKILR